MASIYKKPNSPYWYAQYRVRTATGWKLVRLSTKIKHTPATVTREVKEAAESMGKQLNVLTREQAMTRHNAWRTPLNQRRGQTCRPINYAGPFRIVHGIDRKIYGNALCQIMA